MNPFNISRFWLVENDGDWMVEHGGTDMVGIECCIWMDVAIIIYSTWNLACVVEGCYDWTVEKRVKVENNNGGYSMVEHRLFLNSWKENVDSE